MLATNGVPGPHAVVVGDGDVEMRDIVRESAYCDDENERRIWRVNAGSITYVFDTGANAHVNKSQGESTQDIGEALKFKK